MKIADINYKMEIADINYKIKMSILNYSSRNQTCISPTSSPRNGKLLREAAQVAAQVCRVTA